MFSFDREKKVFRALLAGCQVLYLSQIRRFEILSTLLRTGLSMIQSLVLLSYGRRLAIGSIRLRSEPALSEAERDKLELGLSELYKFLLFKE